MAGELAEEASEDWGYGFELFEVFDEQTEWKQANGNILEIAKMDINHIRNVVRMLRRKNKAYAIPPLMIKMLIKAKEDEKNGK